METEPTYEFHPGKGWVCCWERRILITLYDGKKVWLIDRKPNKGERYKAKRKNRGYDVDGIVDTEAFKNLLADFYWSDVYERSNVEDFDPDFVYVTLVPA